MRKAVCRITRVYTYESHNELHIAYWELQEYVPYAGWFQASYPYLSHTREQCKNDLDKKHQHLPRLVAQAYKLEPPAPLPLGTNAYLTAHGVKVIFATKDVVSVRLPHDDNTLWWKFDQWFRKGPWTIESFMCMFPNARKMKRGIA